MTPAAIIFDMDDTLAATSALWKQAETQLLQILGHEWSAELAAKYKGMNALDVAATIHWHLRPSLSLEEYQRTMRDALFQAFENTPPQPMPGAVACVRRMGRIAPLALASGSPLPLIESTLNHLHLREQFSVLISSESVAKGKPSPDVFLAAAELLKVAPKDCLVLEDSLVGVCSAKAAGMTCFAIPLGHSAEIASLADAVFPSLENVSNTDMILKVPPAN